ncbi:MAG: PQQ-binding-like beta-propeller repeat protein [Bacteroidales bacterium]|nr:PQQ-binding-like beta-propeller repeat protein [Bacteroidales bacterium]
MKKLFLIPIITLFCSFIPFQEIVQWRGANRDGIYNETGLLKQWPENGPKLLWHFDELGDGHSSATVTSKAIFTAGTINGMGVIFSFDLDGKLLWKKEYGKEWTESWPGVRSTPLYVNENIYLMSGYGVVVCLNAENGNIIWSVDLMKDYDGKNIVWGVTENLLVDGNTLYCTPGGADANVIALDRNSGKLMWKSQGKGEPSAYCSPMLIKLSNKRILVTMTANSIIGIDALNGNLLWSHEQTNQYSVHANTPLYSDGYIYCVSGYGKGSVLLKLADDGSSVTEVWRNPSLDNRMGGVVLLNGKLYGAGDKSKKWFVLDWKTGKELSSSEILPKPGNTIYADGMLYCYSENGEVALVEPKEDTFNLISKFKVPFGANQHWAHLVINDKKLYVRHGTSLMVYSIAAN